MEENIINNVTNLKIALYYEMKKYEKIENDITLLNSDISCLKDIINNLNATSYQDLKDYIFIIISYHILHLLFCLWIKYKSH